MKKRYFILLLLFVAWPYRANAQVGKQFWFAAPEMALHSKDMSLLLYISAQDEGADVTISMPADADTTSMKVHVSKNGFEEIILAPDYATYMEYFAAYHNEVNTNALYITSDNPISVYVQMTGVNSETYTLKGENALGYVFRLAGQNKYHNSDISPQLSTYQNAYSSAQIIATEDSTVITIAPNQLLFGDKTIKNREVVLNRGEVYSFRADSKRAENHISGTLISSNKPIVVNTMDDSMSPYQQYFGEDAVADQMVPSTMLGSEYIAIGQGLNWEGVCITDLKTGKTEFVPMKEKETLYIQRENPIQVFQISGFQNEAGGTQLPPLNSGSNIVKYKRLSDSEWCWLHILTRTSNVENIYLDDHIIDPSLFNIVADAPEWSYAIISVAKKDKEDVFSVKSTGDKFQLSVIDASSARKTIDGRPVPTSCSFGYFSNYNALDPIEEVSIPIISLSNDINQFDADYTYTESIDTVISPLDTIIPPLDTIVPPLDSLATNDTIKNETEPEKKQTHHHRLLVYGEGAYSHVPFGNSDFKWGLGYGVGAGILYEYQKEHFLLDVGVGFLWQDVEHKRTLTTTGEITDSQGTSYILQTQHNRSDRSRLGYVEFPILVGGTWDWFYVLGGVKIGVPLFGNTLCQTRVTDVAIYDRFFVPFDNMTNHALRIDVPFSQKKERIDYKFDSRLSLEFGVNLGSATIHHVENDSILDLDPIEIVEEKEKEKESKSNVECRLGVYADYGLFWLPYSGTNLWLNNSDIMQVENWNMSHPLNSTINNKNWAQNFFVGLKLTVMFSLQRSSRE